MTHSSATATQFVIAWEPCKLIQYVEHSVTITGLYVFSKNSRSVSISKKLITLPVVSLLLLFLGKGGFLHDGR